MKKLLGIIILSFILSNKTNAEIFEMKNCYNKGNDTEWAQAEWIKDSSSAKANINSSNGKLEYTNEKFLELEDVILSIDTNRQMIFLTKKFTDFYINNGKTIAKWYETDLGKLQKEEILKGETGVTANSFWKTYIRSLTNRQKFEVREYTLLTYAGGIVIGQLINDNLIVEEKIYIDLEKGTYITGWKLDGNNLPQMGGYICNNQIASKGGGSNGSSGTAFFISNKGHLLTNNHVVEGCEISKISFNNKDYDTKLIATDKTLDLALLKAEIRSTTYFSFSNNDTNKLNKIYVAGFPLGKGLSDDLKISSGIVSSIKGFDDNSNEIQVDAPINPGNSGGPIINESGELVAIAVSGLAKDQTEGINFGIKSSAAESFLNANKIKPKKSLYSRKLNNNKLLDILEKGTVYTYCN